MNVKNLLLSPNRVAIRHEDMTHSPHRNVLDGISAFMSQFMFLQIFQHYVFKLTFLVVQTIGDGGKETWKRLKAMQASKKYIGSVCFEVLR